MVVINDPDDKRSHGVMDAMGISGLGLKPSEYVEQPQESRWH